MEFLSFSEVIMEQNQVILNAIKYIKTFFVGESSGHDYEHSIRVYNLALRLATNEKADSFIVSLASILHDVDDRKLSPNTSSNKNNAREFLKSQNIDNETSSKVIEIIEEVSFKGKDSVVPKTIESKCVQDADRLDAIGAIGVARAFAYGGNHNRKMYDPEIPPKANQSEKEYYNNNSTTINHFYEKLLLLKDMLNTEAAKEIARKRHEYLEGFLNEFIDEWNGRK